MLKVFKKNCISDLKRGYIVASLVQGGGGARGFLPRRREGARASGNFYREGVGGRGSGISGFQGFRVSGFQSFRVSGVQ